LHVNEKIELTRDYEKEIKNHHERDALAAAIKAYKNYRSLFLKTEQILDEMNSPELFDDVIRKVVKDGRENIMDTIEEIVESKKVVEEPKIEIKKTVREEDYQRLIEKLQDRLKQKDFDLEIVKGHLQKLQETSQQLRRRLEETRTTKIIDAEINRLWHRISLLEKELDKLKKMNELMKMTRRAEEDGLIPLVEIEDCSGQNLIELNKMIDLKNRIVFSNCPDVFTLNEFGIRALVRKTPLNEKDMERLEFPVIVVAEEQIEKYEEIRTIKQELFEKEVKAAKKTGLIEWLKGYRKRKV
jgi:predicted RNase H-like nuclease (RuvC/YqgF family)